MNFALSLAIDKTICRQNDSTFFPHPSRHLHTRLREHFDGVDNRQIVREKVSHQAQFGAAQDEALDAAFEQVAAGGEGFAEALLTGFDGVEGGHDFFLAGGVGDDDFAIRRREELLINAALDHAVGGEQAEAADVRPFLESSAMHFFNKMQNGNAHRGLQFRKKMVDAVARNRDKVGAGGSEHLQPFAGERHRGFPSPLNGGGAIRNLRQVANHHRQMLLIMLGRGKRDDALEQAGGGFGTHAAKNANRTKGCHWISELLDCWSIGFWDCWMIGFLDYWATLHASIH